MAEVRPMAGYAHVACAACGNVRHVPLSPDETPPWCLHHDGTIKWGHKHGEGWARMIRATVNVAVDDATAAILGPDVERPDPFRP